MRDVCACVGMCVQGIDPVNDNSPRKEKRKKKLSIALANVVRLLAKNHCAFNFFIVKEVLFDR